MEIFSSLLAHVRFLILVCLLTAFAVLSNAIAQTSPRLIHVFVALADNEHQKIVPVPAAIGNGDDPERNLYWGASYGVRAFFRKGRGWKEISFTRNPNLFVLERSIFVHGSSGTIMVADAYRGREIKQALSDFFRAAAGLDPEIVELAKNANISKSLEKTSLAVYVGHDVLMEPLALAEFLAKSRFQSAGPERRDAIMLACASKYFFRTFLEPTGAQPLIWTTGLMAPEAYTLKDALDGWIADETTEQIRVRAAASYAKYQKISVKAARGLFVTGW